MFEAFNNSSLKPLFFVSPIVEDNLVEYLVVGVLSRDKLSEFLFNKLNLEISSFFLIDSNGLIISNSLDEMHNSTNIYEYIGKISDASELDIKRLEQAININSDELILCGNSEGYYVGYRSISYGSWKTISLTNVKQIIDSGLDAIFMIIVLTLGLALFILLIYVISIISESKHNRIVEEIAYYDSITNSMNIKKLSQIASKKIKKRKNTYALLTLDVVKFSAINDYYGREFGDFVLKTIAKKINDIIPKKTLLARGNGDSFVIFTKYEDNDSLEKIYTTIKNNVTSITDGERITNVSFHCGAYVINDSQISFMVAIDKSTAARKQTRIPGEGYFRIYDHAIDEKLKKERHIELIAKKAFENKEFMAYYQPKVNLKTHKTVGAEALVRWFHDGNIVYPNDFVPIFEANGFVVSLDFYILECVCEDIKRWMEEGREHIIVSVNFSRIHLSDPLLVEKIVKIVDSYMIPHKYIEIEITESVFVNSNIDLIDLTKKLKKEKFSVSMDDFGSGYSSLNALKDINVDVIKLDKDFFQKGRTSIKTKIILTNIINMANELGLKIICEGVETETQTKFLMDLNCYIVQGYYFSKPIPVEDFEKKFLS